MDPQGHTHALFSRYLQMDQERRLEPLPDSDLVRILTPQE